MTNFEKWVEEVGFYIPSKVQIICVNTRYCEDCPIYKKFKCCECDTQKVEKWLESEEE